jgi:hypothetical protein
MNFVLLFLFILTLSFSNSSGTKKELQENLTVLKHNLTALKTKLHTLNNKLAQLKIKLVSNESEKTIRIIPDLTKSGQKYANIFDKLKTDKKTIKTYQPLTQQDIEANFPNIKENLAYFVKFFNNPDDKEFGIPKWVGWCIGCPMASKENRLLLLLCQLNDILGKYSDKTKQFVHTALADGGLRQTCLLVKSLQIMGYKNILINIIDPIIDDYPINTNDESQITMHGKDKIPELNKIFKAFTTFVHYKHAHEYIAAVKEKKALKSHSFDMVDIGSIDHDPYSEYNYILSHEPNNLGEYSVITWPEGSRLIYIFASYHTPPKVVILLEKRFKKGSGTPTQQEKLTNTLNCINQLITNIKIKISDPKANRASLFTWIKENATARKEIFGIYWKDQYKDETTLNEKINKIQYSLCQSAPFDFEELIDKTSEPDPIIYEGDFGEIRRSYNKYVPFIPPKLESNLAYFSIAYSSYSN